MITNGIQPGVSVPALYEKITPKPGQFQQCGAKCCAAHKCESQSGDWQCANLKPSRASLTTAENLGKQMATLCARCALAGVTLYPLENDHGHTVFIVSRWALTRELPDLDAVSAWLDRVTGVQQ